ncbi:hypothetical protein JL721_7309 [Aureococcus anophagefferens]|nr:hypothetical protein JL721_7309 [Aureococcus anophagefferens]
MSTRRALGEVTFNLENEDDKENLLMKPLRTPVVASYDDDELEDATPFSEAPETPADDEEVEEEEEEAVVESPAASPSEWDLLVNEASVRVGAAVLLPPVFYVKAALLGWLVSSDTRGAKVLWDAAVEPLVKPCFEPKEACMALVATGKKVRRRMSACFSPSPVSFEEIHAD